MGIEPTYETFVIPHNGFEDRDRHQAGTHFLKSVESLYQGAAVVFNEE